MEILDPSRRESQWKRQALSDQMKRARSELPPLPWEVDGQRSAFPTSLSPITSGGFVRTILDKGPALIGCAEVQESVVVTSRGPEAFSCRPNSKAIVRIRRARMEQPEEDIRRLALNRLREIVLHDPEATALGSSLVQLGSGLVDDKTISQSFQEQGFHNSPEAGRVSDKVFLVGSSCTRKVSRAAEWLIADAQSRTRDTAVMSGSNSPLSINLYIASTMPYRVV